MEPRLYLRPWLGTLPTIQFVVWPTTSCYADWLKRDHVTLVIIGRCTLEHVTVQLCNMF